MTLVMLHISMTMLKSTELQAYNGPIKRFKMAQLSQSALKLERKKLKIKMLTHTHNVLGVQPDFPQIQYGQ